jgi:oligopeptide transport system substrate-binding protein
LRSTAPPSIKHLKLLPILVITLTGCSLFGSRQPAGRMGGSIVVGLPQIGVLDPARASGSSSLAIIRTACDGLIGLDPRGGAPRPALAASWELAPGAERLRVRLRPNVTFHDGTGVTSEAIREAISRVARPSTASPWVSLVSKVAGFEQIQTGEATHLSGIKLLDRLNLEIELSEPFSDFATVLGHPALVPVSLKSLRADPVGPALPVCAGPYRIERGLGRNDYRLGRSAESASRNSAYLRNGSGFAELILIRSFESAEDAYQAYKSGRVDIAPVPDSRVAEAQAGKVGYKSAPTQEITYLAFDTSKRETSDPRLRQALSLALDRLVIIDAAFGDERRPALRWLPPDYGPASESACNSYVRRIADPERAKQLFASAGVDPASASLPLRFDSNRTGRLVAEAVQVQVKQVLGIDMEVEPMEEEFFSASLRDRQSPAVWILSTNIDLPLPDQFLGALFRTGSPQNALSFSDPDFDLRIDEARRAISADEIRRLYVAAENQLCAKMPAIPLWTSVSNWMINPEQVSLEGRASIDLFGSPILRHAHTRP